MGPFTAAVQRLDVIIDKGVTWPLFYTIKDAGAPRNLTGYLARTKFLEAPGGALLLDAGPYQALGGAAGTVSVKVPDEITAALNWASKKFWTHELESPAGEVVLRLYGDATWRNKTS